jgi:hypothetical protein
LEKVRVEAFADFFLRLFGIYGYALIAIRLYPAFGAKQARLIQAQWLPPFAVQGTLPLSLTTCPYPRTLDMRYGGSLPCLRLKPQV